MSADQMLSRIEALCSKPGKERSGHAYRIKAILGDGLPRDGQPAQSPLPDADLAAAKLEEIKLMCAGPAGRNSRTAQEVLAIIAGEDLQAWSANLPKHLRMQP